MRMVDTMQVHAVKTAVDDTSSSAAGAGWKRFLWLNYVVGFVVTISLILSGI